MCLWEVGESMIVGTEWAQRTLPRQKYADSGKSTLIVVQYRMGSGYLRCHLKTVPMDTICFQIEILCMDYTGQCWN